MLSVRSIITDPVFMYFTYSVLKLPGSRPKPAFTHLLHHVLRNGACTGGGPGGFKSRVSRWRHAEGARIQYKALLLRNIFRPSVFTSVAFYSNFGADSSANNIRRFSNPGIFRTPNSESHPLLRTCPITQSPPVLYMVSLKFPFIGLSFVLGRRRPRLRRAPNISLKFFVNNSSVLG